MDYPFAALVGQEQLKTALLLNAVYPAIGGVLIRGEKGTAKSTAARSLAALLPPLRVTAGCPFRCDPSLPWQDCPHCATLAERQPADIPVPFVDLPLGATEDRVLGTLDFEKALREGRRAFQPGLLAAAHRGVLYIDEVNLLPDHLVDVLLDAAAMGVNTVQREGVSVVHPARFLLIGTMNPEEGELRPQLLDRFGMVVQVSGPRDPAIRAEVVRRRMGFETAPDEFAATWLSEQTGLGERVSVARTLLSGVTLSDHLLHFISQLCCEFEVDGLRPDLALHKTARAHAAFAGRTVVSLEDIRVAAELILPHRRKHGHFEQPESSRQKLDASFERFERDDQSETAESTSNGESKDGSNNNSPKSAESDKHFPVTSPITPRRIEIESDGTASHGRRNPAPNGARGHFVRAVPDEKPTNLAVAATVRAAVQRGAMAEGRLQITPADLHRKTYADKTGTLLIFVVDSSGSMAARERMTLLKNTVLGLLKSAYEQRDEVAVIAFRGPQADVLLSPTRSVELAERSLRELPTGGRTPLAHALVTANTMVQQTRRSHAEKPVLLVVLSDGRANVALPGTTGDPWQQALQAAKELAKTAVPALVLESQVNFVRLGRTEELAAALGAQLLPLEEFSAEKLILRLKPQHA